MSTSDLLTADLLRPGGGLPILLLEAHFQGLGDALDVRHGGGVPAGEDHRLRRIEPPPQRLAREPARQRGPHDPGEGRAVPVLFLPQRHLEDETQQVVGPSGGEAVRERPSPSDAAQGGQVDEIEAARALDRAEFLVVGELLPCPVGVEQGEPEGGPLALGGFVVELLHHGSEGSEAGPRADQQHALEAGRPLVEREVARDAVHVVERRAVALVEGEEGLGQAAEPARGVDLEHDVELEVAVAPGLEGGGGDRVGVRDRAALLPTHLVQLRQVADLPVVVHHLPGEPAIVPPQGDVLAPLVVREGAARGGLQAEDREQRRELTPVADRPRPPVGHGWRELSLRAPCGSTPGRKTPAALDLLRQWVGLHSTARRRPRVTRSVTTPGRPNTRGRSSSRRPGTSPPGRSISAWRSKAWAGIRLDAAPSVPLPRARFALYAPVRKTSEG